MKLNNQSVSYVSQRPVGGIEKHVRTFVILWSYPLPFQDSPERFSNVQMRGVWRKEEDEESSLFPYRPEFLDPPVAVYGSIVKHYKGVLSDAEGKIIKETDNLICRHPLCSGESFILIARVIMPKMLSRATRWEGTKTSSPSSCHPYGT